MPRFQVQTEALTAAAGQIGRSDASLSSAGAGFQGSAGALDPLAGTAASIAFEDFINAAVVGVRHQPVERIVAELHADKFHPYIGPTICTPIGYVMPANRFTTWTFGTEDSPAQADDLVRALEEYGLPFMRAHTDLAAIRDAVERDQGHLLEYKLPVVLALLGEHEAARALDERLAELGEAENPYAQDFRRYATRFHEHQADLAALAG